MNVYCQQTLSLTSISTTILELLRILLLKLLLFNRGCQNECSRVRERVPIMYGSTRLG